MFEVSSKSRISNALSLASLLSVLVSRPIRRLDTSSPGGLTLLKKSCDHHHFIVASNCPFKLRIGDEMWASITARGYVVSPSPLARLQLG